MKIVEAYYNDGRWTAIFENGNKVSASGPTPRGKYLDEGFWAWRAVRPSGEYLAPRASCGGFSGAPSETEQAAAMAAFLDLISKRLGQMVF